MEIFIRANEMQFITKNETSINNKIQAQFAFKHLRLFH